MSKFKIKDLAERLNAQIEGNQDLFVTEICPLSDSKFGALTFIKESSPKRVTKLLTETKASAVLVRLNLLGKVPAQDKTLLFVPDPQAALSTLLPSFYPKPSRAAHISEKAAIHSSAQIGKNCTIGAFCSIGENASIGDNCTLHPNVCVYENVTIGNNCTIHAAAVLREGSKLGNDCVVQPGAVLGADGFGYIFQAGVGLTAIPQVGVVAIGNNVDIGANTCIDRAALGQTSIGDGSKLDNLVQVGHNVKIGPHCILCGQVGVGGSSELGAQVTLGGNCGVADHVKVASQSRIAAKAGVSSSIATKGDYAGHPAIPVRTWQRITACLPKLPQFLKHSGDYTKANGEKDNES